MTDEKRVLAGRVRTELSAVAVVVDRAVQAWHSDDKYFLDSVALNLHSFYAGLERVFQLIASHIDGFAPQCEGWHRELLCQMASEIPELRPPILSAQTKSRLDPYRGFRHVVRNVYIFEIDAELIKPLVDGLVDVFSLVNMELEEFLRFLEDADRQ